MSYVRLTKGQNLTTLQSFSDNLFLRESPSKNSELSVQSFGTELNFYFYLLLLIQKILDYSPSGVGSNKYCT